MIDKEKIANELLRLKKAHMFYLLYENKREKVREIFAKAQPVIDLIKEQYPDDSDGVQMFCEWLIIGGGEFLESVQKEAYQQKLDI